MKGLSIPNGVQWAYYQDGTLKLKTYDPLEYQEAKVKVA